MARGQPDILQAAALDGEVSHSGKIGIKEAAIVATVDVHVNLTCNTRLATAKLSWPLHDQEHVGTCIHRGFGQQIAGSFMLECEKERNEGREA